MKETLLLGLSLCVGPLAANSQYSFEEFTFLDNIGAEISLPASCENWAFHVRYDMSDTAKIEAPDDVRGQSIRYGEGDARAAYTFKFNRCSAFRLTAGYQNTYLDWKENPDFTTNCFHNGYLNLGFATMTGDCWSWQVEGSINADLDHLDDRSTLYFLGAWGNYQVTQNLGTQVGFVYRGGIRQDRFWPVIGINWELPPSFSIHIVYPINMSIAYNITPNWALAVVGKVINTRHRLKDDEPLPCGIMEYSNYGVELALNYRTCSLFNANIHIGFLTDGELKTADSRNNSATYYKTEGVGYVGAGLALKF